MKSLLTNWKTTLVGAMIAGFIAIQPIVSTGSVDWKKIGLAFAIAAFAALTGDAKKQSNP